MDPDDIYNGPTLTAAQATDRTDVGRACDDLAAAVAEIEHRVRVAAATAEFGDLDLADPAALLAAVSDARARLAAAATDLQNAVHKATGAGDHLAGDRLLRVKPAGWDRKRWDSERLLSHLVGMAQVDADGVKADPETSRRRLVELLAEVLPLTGSLAWRVTALRDRGVDPDEWCDKEKGRPTVQVLPAPPKPVDTEGAGQ